MRVLVSGGGTAGHISPILATVDALKSLDKELEVLYVGTAKGMEAKIVGRAGIDFAAISAGKLRRYAGRNWWNHLLDLHTLVLNIRDIFRVMKGIIQSCRIIKHFEPGVIFIKGGYVGLPVGLAAKLLGVPFVIHESDIVPGLTNRILSRWASVVAVGFPANKYTDLPTDRLVYTGNPVRKALLGKHRLEGLAHFQLSADLPAVLITGGSQGAERVNNAVLKALPLLLETCQVIHLTGERDIGRVKFQVKRLGLKRLERYQCFSFLGPEMGLAYAAADVVVARAGANTIAELAALKKPSILIPGSHLRDQPTNAQVLAREGVVRVIQEDRLHSTVLVGEITRILTSEEEQERLGSSIAEYAVPDAPKLLARAILGAAGER
jgi:UDP-N-acetylglucosamine--N-acetylmuramyl-(pentapeptide) pyrophosphoryl-undecaprenol N-acetylglucosamine transferase